MGSQGRLGVLGLGPIGLLAAQAARARGATGRQQAVIDTVGTERSIRDGMPMLAKGGVLVLLAVHDVPVSIAPIALASERRLVTSSNNRYAEFPAAIELLASGAVKVSHLVTHRFPLQQAPAAFDMLLKSGRTSAYKVVLLP
jgi:threonine dehydrogenase-like Zn-dependent dehydrogenase